MDEMGVQKYRSWTRGECSFTRPRSRDLILLEVGSTAFNHTNVVPPPNVPPPLGGEWGTGGRGGGVSAAVSIKKRREEGASAVLYGVYPGSSSVVYFVLQNKNLEYRGATVWAWYKAPKNHQRELVVKRNVVYRGA